MSSSYDMDQSRNQQDQQDRGQRQRGGSGSKTMMRPDTAPVAIETEQGQTRIAADVVAKIAGLAAREIPGVYAMGGGIARRVGQLRSLIPGATEAATQGVSVEVGEHQAAIDLNLVTWYGQSIVDVSDAVRRSVAGQVEGMTGLDVVAVNVQVDDIHVESSSDRQQQSSAQ